MDNTIKQQKSKLPGVLLIIVAIVLIYSNSFDVPWHLDDYDNIPKNPRITISDLYPATLIQTFFASYDSGAYRGEHFYRPVTMFSFAMNWYFGKGSIWGFHFINLLIHILSGLLLFFTIDLLLQTPKFHIERKTLRYQTALLAAFLWAVHPIHTMAVTYIVQRMASIAGMFYLLGLFTYLKLRLVSSSKKKVMFGIGYLISFILAYGSKENAILLPAATLMVEFIFFQKITARSLFKPKIVVSIFILLVFFIVMVLIYTGGDIQVLMENYSNRRYTPIERLMTESRILCLYLYQLVYPVASQFSIEHDITISRSLISPWTTSLAIFFILSLLGVSLNSLKKRPAFSFTILFFFLNHLVESTFLDLELIFEHRNYIPSMFFFFPLSIWFVNFISRHKNKNTSKLIIVVICGGVSVVLMVVSMGTYIRNIDWKTKIGLWESAIGKAPNRARPFQNLAVFQYQEKGDWDKAIDYHKKSLELQNSRPLYTKMVAYDNLRQCYLKKGEIDTAVKYGMMAVTSYASNAAINNYLETLVLANELEKAGQVLKRNQEKSRDIDLKRMNLRTLIYLKNRRKEKAQSSALDAIQKNPFSPVAMTFFGYANLLSNNYGKADHFLNKAIQHGNDNQVYLHLSLIQNSLNQGNVTKSKAYTEQMIERFPITTVLDLLEKTENEPYPILPFSFSQIRTAIELELKNINSEAG
ncbi:MAG: tetratricopeptide repeat protein [Desulfobacter sp.]|nr:MAG: tetratricopeptide repeat protein [Desulfobacter sp.]